MFDRTNNKGRAVRTGVAFVAALVADVAHHRVRTVLREVPFLEAAVAPNRIAAVRGDVTHFATTTADLVFRTVFHQMSFFVAVQTAE